MQLQHKTYVLYVIYIIYNTYNGILYYGRKLKQYIVNTYDIYIIQRRFTDKVFKVVEDINYFRMQME